MSKINKEIMLSKTINCHKNFRCIESENRIGLINKIERCLDGIYFTKCNELCKHKIPFGSVAICCCPNRIEIYKIYNV